MAKYKIAWLPGDGVGIEVMEAARIVLDRIGFDAEYIHGDIGWEFWRTEGDAFPARTVELLKNVDAAMFGAITSKPVKAAEAELVDSLKGKGLHYRSPIVRMRQTVRPLQLPAPVQGVPGQPAQLQGRHRPRRLPREHRGPLRRRRVQPGARRSCADTLGKLSKPFAPFGDAAGRRVRRVLQDQHEEGLGAHRPRRVRVRPQVRPQEGHRRPQGERRARHRRPVPRAGARGGEGASRKSSWTRPTSTP